MLSPTSGQVDVRGRVVPVLDLGAGLDPELSGLENIFLNAMFLGRTRAEVAAACDGIVAASGLGEFIDSPLRNYSAGMAARLAFSVATAWVPDVLILDEVLAVGDAGFVAKCHQRLQEFRDRGSTVLRRLARAAGNPRQLPPVDLDSTADASAPTGRPRT